MDRGNHFEDYILELDSLPFLTRYHWHDFGWAYLYRIGKTDYYVNAEFGRLNLRYYKSPATDDGNKQIILTDLEMILPRLPKGLQSDILFNINLFR
jgi:hypothetical protein